MVVATRARRLVVPTIAASVVLLALVIGGAVLVFGSSDSTEQTAAPGSSAAPSATSPPITAGGSIPASTAAPPASTVPTTTTTPPTTVAAEASATTRPLDPVAAATASTVATIDSDRPAVDALLGTWAPQISAKRDGLEWEGIVYDLPLIVALHQDLDAQYGALLVNGAEYNFRIDDAPMSGWFITIADRSFPTADGALDWCRSNSIDRENCAAKLITNDQNASATLVLQ